MTHITASIHHPGFMNIAIFHAPPRHTPRYPPDYLPSAPVRQTVPGRLMGINARLRILRPEPVILSGFPCPEQTEGTPRNTDTSPLCQCRRETRGSPCLKTMSYRSLHHHFPGELAGFPDSADSPRRLPVILRHRPRHKKSRPLSQDVCRVANQIFLFLQT